jgi:hypothetical protein
VDGARRALRAVEDDAVRSRTAAHCGRRRVQQAQIQKSTSGLWMRTANRKAVTASSAIPESRKPLPDRTRRIPGVSSLT